MNEPPVIICQRDEHDLRQWTAWFESQPGTAFGAPRVPMDSVKRLLTETNTAAGFYQMTVVSPPNDPLQREVEWAPPELLFTCQECRGRGEVDLLTTVAKCRRCNGRGKLPG